MLCRHRLDLRGWKLRKGLRWTSGRRLTRVTRAAGEQGVLYATGTENSGASIFVQNNKLVVDYNAFDDHLIVESEIDVPVGSSALGVQVRRTGAKTGTISLSLDGVATEPTELPLFMTMILVKLI